MNEQLNTLDAFKLNSHTIYQNGECQIVCGLNMIEFASYQFNSSYVILNLNIIKDLCKLTKEQILLRKRDLENFAINGLIDSIKISICFENIAKAKLLVAGYIIHKINKNVFPELAKKQLKEPIKIEEFQDYWKKNKKINSNNERLCETISGVSFNTINYSLILKNEKYNSRLKLNNENLTHLIKLNNLRNELHLQNALSFKLDNNSFLRYSELAENVSVCLNNAKENLPNLINLERKDTIPKFTMK